MNQKLLLNHIIDSSKTKITKVILDYINGTTDRNLSEIFQEIKNISDEEEKLIEQIINYNTSKD